MSQFFFYLWTLTQLLSNGKVIRALSTQYDRGGSSQDQLDGNTAASAEQTE